LKNKIKTIQNNKEQEYVPALYIEDENAYIL